MTCKGQPIRIPVVVIPGWILHSSTLIHILPPLPPILTASEYRFRL